MVGSARQNPGGWPRCPSHPQQAASASQGHQFPSWPRPGMSCISPPGRWAAGDRRGDVPTPGRSPLQAEQTKVMLFPDLPLPIPQSLACPVLPAVPCPGTAEVGGGSGLGAAHVATPAAPFAPLLLPAAPPAPLASRLQPSRVWEQQMSVR